MPKYFKFLGKNKTNRDFQYKLGLNVDTISFNDDEDEVCVKGGLYFSEAKDIIKHNNSFHEWLAEVELPDDEPLITFKDKSRAHQLIVKKFYKLDKVKTWKYLAEQGVDIHAEDEYALLNSAEKGHFEVVKYLVEQGADIHVGKEYALRYAAAYGHLEVVKYLVEQGADIHAEEDSALRNAAEKGHFEVVKYLVEQGANINARDYSALRYAAAYGNLEVVKYLVKLGADIHAEEDSALRIAEGQGHLEVVKYLKSIK
mgnify:CR=1 FL=1